SLPISGANGKRSHAGPEPDSAAQMVVQARHGERPEHRAAHFHYATDHQELGCRRWVSLPNQLSTTGQLSTTEDTGDTEEQTCSSLVSSVSSVVERLSMVER